MAGLFHSPGVSHDDAIRIEHGHNLEEELVAQPLRGLGAAGQVVDEAAHDPGGGRLTGVHATRQQDHLLLPHLALKV